MLKSDFGYDLPERLIAQTPLERRDVSRLLTLDKKTGGISHRHFYELPELLRPGDCLVINDSRVIPARIYATRADTGTRIELLLLRDVGENRWECLVKPGRSAKPGVKLRFGDELSGEVLGKDNEGTVTVGFSYSGVFLTALSKIGEAPLPPYIHEKLDDPERYQTVYARDPGSSAAPTAGLHFTPELMDAVRGMGVEVAELTLHVGVGTFRPVKTEDIREHVMHSEYCVIPAAAAEKVNRVKKNGGRVVAVGTTSCRTLESFAAEDGSVPEASGYTDIFIYPGYRFKCVDALVTNFHLPESTLIMLVSALAGRENVLDAYRTAVGMEYRFFSFGDAMFIY